MLVSLFRSGPLRHHIAKGYIVAAEDVDRLLTDLAARPPALPAPNGVRLGVRIRPEQGAVWLATGPQWMLDPARRRALVAGLAEGTAALAGAVATRGGPLLPGGRAPAAPGPGRPGAHLAP